MVVKKSNIFKISIAIVGFFLLVLVASHWFVKSKIESFLKNDLPNHIELEYSNVDLNIISGSIAIDNIVLTKFTKENYKIKGILKADKLTIKNVAYTSLLIHKEIEVNYIDIKKPSIRHFTGFNKKTKENDDKNKSFFNNPITIKKLNSTNGNVQVLDSNKETVFSAKDINISLKNCVFKIDDAKNKIPFSYGNSEVLASTIFADLGPFENATISKLTAKNNVLTAKNLQLKTKYTKEELSKNIKTERDYIDLNIPELELKNISYGYNKTKFFINIPKTEIHNPKLEIYRDKLVTDDLSHKSMYSKMLRDLPIHLAMDSILINKGHIAYQEKLEPKISPEKLYFSNIDASIANLNNTSKKNTTVTTKSKLMGKTPLELSWAFSISKTTDFFTAWGSFKDLDIKSINPFLNSNLRATAEGDMQRMYFTISGNRQNAAGDLKIKYNNFKFKILKKDRLGVNKLLTKLGNLIIKEGSKTNPKDFRYGKIKVERDTTKSFFNYLWISVKGGLLDALTGKGVKEE